MRVLKVELLFAPTARTKRPPALLRKALTDLGLHGVAVRTPRPIASRTRAPRICAT